MNRPAIEQSHSAGFKDSSQRDELLLSPATLNVLDRSNADTEVARAKKSKRIPALDFTKGALVLIMVLYHWMNYFVTADGSIYKYLRFLTPSFIFITGFLISQVSLSKYQASGLHIPGRLLLRGVKLLGIVFILNIAISTVNLKGLQSRVTHRSPYDTVEAYLTGTAPVAFSVLVPIAYLLILSAGLLVVSRRYRNIYHLTCGAFVACAFLLELQGINTGYLQIFSIGMLGVSVGYIPIGRINGLLKGRLGLCLAYLAYLFAITLWNDVYPLQIVGVCLSLAIIYRIGVENADSGHVSQVAILLGQYSLFAYISQIVILQVLRRSLGFLGTGIGVSGAAFFACVSCTILSVEVLDRARIRMAGLDKVYTAVFG
jgi:peptidoglycan/LPS O-acetylase OafA/YrhL